MLLENMLFNSRYALVTVDAEAQSKRASQDHIERPYLGEEDVIQGWWSAKECDIEPNYAFNYELNSATGVFATLFSFSDTLVPDIDWSKVNVSGRKAQFRWRDAKKAHELRIERPESGDLTVSYSTR
jgi:hypothetical protein